MMWTSGAWAALALSGVIGLSLGLVGGGGSIITVPVLVYVAGLSAREGVALSLPIVGVTALVGALAQWREGNVHGRAALIFSVMGMLGAVGGARLTPLVPPPVLMTLFAALMIAVGIRMAHGADEEKMPRRAECNPLKCGATGLGLGVLTGFLGVGGGFLLVPALLSFARLPMRQAVGTSLLIIAANSAAGFLAHQGEVQGHFPLAAALTGAAVAGMVAGLRLSRRVQTQSLKKIFGALALGVAVFLLAMNFRPLLALVANP